jgi:predicted dehydrogenase
MAQVNIGVIGTGIIGNSHLKNYQKCPEAKVVAVCDISEESARKAAQEFGVGHVYTDYHKLLERDDIQAVDVCLHNNLHAPVATAAMRAGKHVYCEKPLAGSFADAKTMIDTAEETGMHLAMQLATLFNDGSLAAKRLIEEGALGKIYYAKSFGFRRRGRPYVDGYATPAFVQKKVAAGGALFDMGVYHICQMLYLLGAPKVLTISGATHQEIDMYAHRRESSGYDVEELGVGFVRLEGGISFFIEEAWALNLGGDESSKIAGSKGGVTLNPFTYHATIGDMEMNATVDVGAARGRWKMVWPEQYTPFDGNQQHWVAVLQGLTPPLPSARVGMDMMLIAEGMFMSQELGREVTAEEVVANSKSTALKL